MLCALIKHATYTSFGKSECMLCILHCSYFIKDDEYDDDDDDDDDNCIVHCIDDEDDQVVMLCIFIFSNATSFTSLILSSQSSRQHLIPAQR